MKFFDSFCCRCVDSSVVTVPSASPHLKVPFNVESSREKESLSGEVFGDLLHPKEPPYNVSLSCFNPDNFTAESSSDSGSFSVSSVIKKNAFRSKPKSSQELIFAFSDQNSNTSNASMSPLDWGYPGYLSEDEYEVYVKFHNEVCQRSDDYQQTILCFGKEESEEYALCRWLRARKFDLSKTIKMVEEAMNYRAEAAKEDFFPNGSKALGVEKSIYYIFYPEVFVGYTKYGYPLYITKAADANMPMLNCVTTSKGMTNFHWHSMMYVLGGNLRRRALSDPTFHRFEACIVVDLERITVGTAIEMLPILKGFIAIDQLCFPECLNRFIFINAPSFFASIWHLVRPLVDPHTASKVDIFASKKVWQARLLDLIGADHLPSDYGGTAPPQVERFLKLTKEKFLRRQVTYPIFLRFSWSVALFDFVLNDEDDMMELLVLTKTQKVCTFSVIKQDTSGNELVQVVEVKHILIGDEHPTRFQFPQLLDSPGNYQVRVNCSEGPGTWVLVGKVFNKKQTISRHNMLTTYITEAGGQRYSNPLFASRLKSVPELEAQQVQPQRRRSSLNVLHISGVTEEQLSGSIPLIRKFVPIFVFIIIIMIIVFSVFCVIIKR